LTLDRLGYTPSLIQEKEEGMLGNQIGEVIGQVTTMRVLPFEGSLTKMEVSFQGHGRLLDCDVNEIGTYISALQADGSLFGEGQGVEMASDGSVARWEGTGSGRITGPGRTSWRGTIHYSNATGSLSPLNGTCGAFEYEVDESGKSEAKIFEWK
jgi:hypothetical protein